MMNGDSVLLKMIMAFIYIWKKDNFLFWDTKMIKTIFNDFQLDNPKKMSTLVCKLDLRTFTQVKKA